VVAEDLGLGSLVDFDLVGLNFDLIGEFVVENYNREAISR